MYDWDVILYIIPNINAYKAKVVVLIFSIAHFLAKLFLISRIMRMKCIISDKQFVNSFW